MKIKKAVIPAAGFGTRMLPATKAIPKCMIPIVDRPAIQYNVEEAVNSGIKDILIIIGRGQEAIVNHFDRNPELEYCLEKSNKIDFLKSIKTIPDDVNIYFVRQRETKGLGHAIYCAKAFVGNEPFAVLSGDDVIKSNVPVCRQLINAYEEFGKPVVGAQKVPENEICKYGSLKVENIHDNYFLCTNMVEKPTPDKVLSLYSILGRYILTPEIFEILENTRPGAGGEIQITDAMKKISNQNGIIAVDFEGKRYDIGNKFGAIQANIEFALEHPEISDQFENYLKNNLDI